MIDLGGYLADEGEDTDQQHDVCSLLDVLADGRTEELLQELLTATEPLSAQELNDRCDIPQSTVYRRLDELTGHGVIQEERELDVDGRNVATYEVVLEGFDLQISSTGYRTIRHERDDEQDDPLEASNDDPIVMSLNITK